MIAQWLECSIEMSAPAVIQTTERWNYLGLLLSTVRHYVIYVSLNNTVIFTEKNKDSLSNS